MENFFGIPWSTAAIVAACIAILYSLLWPKPKGSHSTFTRIVLRWSHSLVWWLLMLVCLSLSGIITVPEILIGLIAWSALGVYSVFLFTLIYNRVRNKT